jgi:hypothetical protein
MSWRERRLTPADTRASSSGRDDSQPAVFGDVTALHTASVETANGDVAPHADEDLEAGPPPRGNTRRRIATNRWAGNNVPLKDTPIAELHGTSPENGRQSGARSMDAGPTANGLKMGFGDVQAKSPGDGAKNSGVGLDDDLDSVGLAHGKADLDARNPVDAVGTGVAKLRTGGPSDGSQNGFTDVHPGQNGLESSFGDVRMGHVREGLEGSGDGWQGEGSWFESGPSQAQDAEGEPGPGPERDGQAMDTPEMELHWCWSHIRLMSGLGLYCNWFTGEASPIICTVLHRVQTWARQATGTVPQLLTS